MSPRDSQVSPNDACSVGVLSLYPERVSFRATDGLSRVSSLASMLPASLRLPALRGRQFLTQVNQLGHVLQAMSDDKLAQETAEVRRELRNAGTSFAASARSFALIRETAARVLGKRHFDSQVLAGWVMLSGHVAEMETGEGKTLAVALAAATAALAGLPVHVITVNDYLAERDAVFLMPLYQALGLATGVVAGDTGPEERHAAYSKDLTYCTAKELAFDYLRDRQVFRSGTSDIVRRVDRIYGAQSRTSRLLLRGLGFGIMDECDSILIDEARTPVILSRPTQDPHELPYHQALALAGALAVEQDYRCNSRDRSIELTARGRDRLAELAASLEDPWCRPQEREAMVRNALSALHLFHRDHHYLVRDGEVLIIDENTGRVRPGQSWERGLHQMIEAKEGCGLSEVHHVLARISFQRLFRRYLRFAGTTATATEVAGELRSVYGVGVVPIPTHRPAQRQHYAERTYAQSDEKWAAIVERVRELHQTGRPVLIGTRSVAASELLSRRLEQAGLSHQVLSARHDRGEAEVVAHAGQRGLVTVATNMAGRGTDIPLGEGVVGLGGLHVIATERHEARRIDRQLFGRCGRQGDPGSSELFTSLEDELIDRHCPRWLVGLAVRGLHWLPRHGRILASIVGRMAQRRAERFQGSARLDLLSADERIGQALGFAGPAE